MKYTIKNVTIAVSITFFWMLLITVAAFPDLLENFGKFQKQFDFQIAKTIILVVLVYLFDVFTKLMITPLSYVSVKYATALLIFIMLILSILYFAMYHPINSIYAIVIVSLIMGFIECLSILQVLKTTENNPVKLKKV